MKKRREALRKKEKEPFIIKKVTKKWKRVNGNISLRSWCF
jgi:hypothetical protein